MEDANFEEKIRKNIINYTTMETNRTDVLFILKKRTVYSEYSYSAVNSGLYNSANFVNEMLQDNDIDSSLVEVVDNNEIDKYVAMYKPKNVIIEALWVVPEKFEVLQKLHPDVRWIIRLHSELPFLANEGIAIEWLRGYMQYKNVFIASNSEDFIKSMSPLFGHILYMPNFYPEQNLYKADHKPDKDHYNIGLFGAIRPLKNSLTQAIAAIMFAEVNNKILNLHINTERIEQKGENVLKNVRALFEGTKHNLVEHKWLHHEDFLELVSTMDLGLQVSLSETYNIVAADFVSQKIPIVTSKEIPFVNRFSTTKKTRNAKAIALKMEIAMMFRKPITFINSYLLRKNSCEAERIWMKLFK